MSLCTWTGCQSRATATTLVCRKHGDLMPNNPHVRDNIIRNMRRIARDMADTGYAAEYVGAFGLLADRGRAMAHGADQLRAWADELELEIKSGEAA